jgi:hypothetical protein
MGLKFEVRFRYGEPQIFADANSAACAITENEDYIDDIEVDIDDYLDESYGHIEICGEDFWASKILYELYQDRYYEIQNDERRNTAENNLDWVEDTLDRMDDGDEESFEGGIRVICFDDGEDEDEDDEDERDSFMSIFDYAT